LHGWQYIAQSHSSTAKHLFWGVIVSLSMLTAFFFLYNNTKDFLKATVVMRSSKPPFLCPSLFI